MPLTRTAVRPAVTYSVARSARAVKKISDLRRKANDLEKTHQALLNETSTVLGTELRDMAEALATNQTEFIVKQTVTLLEKVSKLLLEPPREKV